MRVRVWYYWMDEGGGVTHVYTFLAVELKSFFVGDVHVVGFVLWHPTGIWSLPPWTKKLLAKYHDAKTDEERHDLYQAHIAAQLVKWYESYHFTNCAAMCAW